MDERRGGLRRQMRRLVDLRVIGWPLFWFSYAWYLLEAGFAFLRTEPRTAQGGVALVVAATAAQLATFAVLLLAKYTYLRPRMARRHPSWMVLTFALAALTGGIIAGAVQQALQPELSDLGGPGLFNHTVYMTLAFCIVGVVIVALREHQADVASLAAARESLIATRVAGERARAVELNQVNERVQTLADELRSTLPGLAPTDASAALGHAAGGVIRPLSHELALSAPEASRETVAEVPYPSWLTTLRSIASGPPLIRPALMGLTAMVLSASTTVASPDPAQVPPGTQGVQVSVDLAGLFESLAQLVLVFVVVWFFARVAGWLLRRLSLDESANAARAWEVTILATVGIAVMSQLVLGVIFDLAGFGLPVGTLVGMVQFTVALLAVVAVVAVINTTAVRRQAAVAELASTNEDLDWEVRRTNELLWRQRRELSTWLHGPVQASLNAGAIQLAQDGADQADIEGAVRLFTEACAKLPTGGQPKDINAELAAVRDTWAPLCEVSWHLDSATAARIGADPTCAATLSDVIVEGCSNSVIHGGATTIDIRLEAEGERSIVLVLANNGTPVAEGSSGASAEAGGGGVGSAGVGSTGVGGDGAGGTGVGGGGEVHGGLGTQMLNDVCLEWERVSGALGTVLEARFPLGDGSAVGYPAVNAAGVGTSAVGGSAVNGAVPSTLAGDGAAVGTTAAGVAGPATPTEQQG